MAIVTTLDVGCDYGLCSTWGEGVSGRGPWVTPGRARTNAREFGFVRRRVAGRMVDLCREHAEVTDLGVAYDGPVFDPDAQYETVPVHEIPRSLPENRGDLP